jgi:hypothetical protein
VRGRRLLFRFRLAVACLLVLRVFLGTPGQARAQEVVTLPPVQADSISDALRELTRGSGNAGIGGLISGLTGIEVATAPLGSPSGGFVFAYDEAVGAYIRRSDTFGPQFVERALTTGRFTASFGLNVLNATYDTISGTSLDNIRVATFAGPSPIVTSSTLDLRVRSQTATFFSSLGLTDSLDVAIAVPVVRVDLDGVLIQEEGAIGTAILPAAASSTGLGDIGLVGKYRIWSSANSQNGVAALVTLRAPTGDEDNLRGVNAWRTLVSATASVGLGELMVHAMGGYEFWDRSVQLPNTLPNNTIESWFLADQVQYGAGFEFEAHPAVTVTAEVLGSRLRGGGRLDPRSIPAGAPALGIESLQLLVSGPNSLHTVAVIPGMRWNIGNTALLSLSAKVSLVGTGLRDRFTPVVGFNWTLFEP